MNYSTGNERFLVENNRCCLKMSFVSCFVRLIVVLIFNIISQAKLCNHISFKFGISGEPVTMQNILTILYTCGKLPLCICVLYSASFNELLCLPLFFCHGFVVTTLIRTNYMHFTLISFFNFSCCEIVNGWVERELDTSCEELHICSILILCFESIVYEILYLIND